ncbi:MAG: ADP-ribosylglycohydrolase family protein [Syntrophorhabdus sp.]
MTLTRSEKILGGVWGALVGDALGVPVEFQERRVRKKDPVAEMRGYGTFDLPPGSWSDDSSLMLCTVQSLVDGFDTDSMGKYFVEWLNNAHWTPYGLVFDVGYGTRQAIGRIDGGIPAQEAGGTEVSNNGNGSLMRILPVGLCCSPMAVPKMLSHIHRASSITHGHPRSLMACGIYCLMVRELLSGIDTADAYTSTMALTKTAYSRQPFDTELPHFARLLEGTITDCPEDAIDSDGYVVHTLEAAFWCFLTTGSYREAVLKAVNLGYDTDTTAIVTGGLAGIYYGARSIPQEWLNQIARRKEIEQLFILFAGKMAGNDHGPA